MSYPTHIRSLLPLFSVKPLRSVYIRNWLLFLSIYTSSVYGTIDKHGLQLDRLQRLAVCTHFIENPYMQRPNPVSINSLQELSAYLGRALPTNLQKSIPRSGMKRVRDVASQAASEGSTSTSRNHSQHPPEGRTHHYVEGNNVLIWTESTTATQIRENLSTDALNIVSSSLRESDIQRTTCLCAAFKKPDGTIKKFAFHSGSGEMPSFMYRAANEKGYDVIQSERSHAEGQMVQFLLDNATEYTHIVGMGCSRLYCAECNILLGLILGQDWAQIATAMYDPLYASNHNTITTEGAYFYSHNTRLYRQTFNRSMIYLPAKTSNDAISNASCRLYKLPELLRKKLELTIAQRIKFTGNRF